VLARNTLWREVRHKAHKHERWGQARGKAVELSAVELGQDTNRALGCRIDESFNQARYTAPPWTQEKLRKRGVIGSALPEARTDTMQAGGSACLCGSCMLEACTRHSRHARYLRAGYQRCSRDVARICMRCTMHHARISKRGCSNVSTLQAYACWMQARLCLRGSDHLERLAWISMHDALTCERGWAATLAIGTCRIRSTLRQTTIQA
jgi:hypothetical protein